jgi:DNA repair exonuclease SbcCD ATPase subunit
LLDTWRNERALRKHAASAARAVMAVMLALIALGIVAVVVALLTRSPIAVGAVFACAAAAGWCGVVLWRGARARTRLAGHEASVVATATRIGLAAGSGEEAGEAAEATEREAARAVERAREAEVLMRQRDSDVAAVESSAADKRSRIVETQAVLAGLRAKTGFESLPDLETAVARRRALEGQVTTRLALLRGWIPSAARAADRDGFLRACEAEVARGLDPAAPMAPAEEPDALPRVEVELERVAGDERALRQQLGRTRQELGRIEVRITDLAAIDGPVHCRTTRELADAQHRITEFCESVRRDARLAQEAIRILQEIEAEEDEKVGELFGADALVSRWFHEITGGRYRAVHLDAGEVVVEVNDGTRLSASALSGGAFDQLYLAIRASIAERMLPESKGFFVLDDPFLKADRDRMHALMRMLHRLVERGWQVIYVTAKDEVVDALRADISAGAVQLIELERTLFTPRPARARTELTDAPRLL